jgi:predicted transposase/invertase (TIGR01784 family)
LIEIQAISYKSFPKRILYYWSKVYSRSLVKNQKYEKLKKVYSINFLKEPLWKKRPEFLSTFHILEKDRKFQLTEDLEIHIVELSKFLRNVENLQTNLDAWF